MKKNSTLLVMLVGLFFGMFSFVRAQESPVLTATLSSTTPASKSIQVGMQHIDVAKFTLKASDGDIFLKGIYLDTDIPGGLNNFTNLYLYVGSTYVGSYPNQGEKPNLVEFPNVIIGNGKTKTYSVHATIPITSAGKIRVGFSGFTFGTLTSPSLVNVPIYGNTMTFADYAGNPIPTPLVSNLIPTPQPVADSPLVLTPAMLGFTSLAAIGLTEGDTVGVMEPDDPNIYIVNDSGYKRLFLNPVIFNFYGHLGGFTAVKNVDTPVINSIATSNFVRNCETNDPKVYGLEVTAEDSGVLHWINTSGSQAVADDPEFFKKVFCINNNEFQWYSQGSVFTSVSQVPSYSR